MTLLATDARNRAARTLYQGLVLDVLVAIGVALAAWLPDADVTAGEAWAILAASLAKSVLQAGASWLMRLKLDGSQVPTPLPPESAGEPSEDLTEDAKGA